MRPTPSAEISGCADKSTEVQFTNKIVGCDYDWNTPGMDAAAAACAPGWGLCRSSMQVDALGLTRVACDQRPRPGTFYALGQSFGRGDSCAKDNYFQFNTPECQNGEEESCSEQVLLDLDSNLAYDDSKSDFVARGGTCTCPSGEVYYVGVFLRAGADDCGALACFNGGVPGECSIGGIPPSAAAMAVKCGPVQHSVGNDLLGCGKDSPDFQVTSSTADCSGAMRHTIGNQNIGAWNGLSDVTNGRDKVWKAPGNGGVMCCFNQYLDFPGFVLPAEPRVRLSDNCTAGLLVAPAAPTNLPDTPELTPVCGCERSRETFCNYDFGDSGRCESCSSHRTIGSCDNAGLPPAGARDCKKWCFLSSMESHRETCKSHFDCAEGDFCAVECFVGPCGAAGEISAGRRGHFCQPCDECSWDDDAFNGNCGVCGLEHDEKPEHDDPLVVDSGHDTATLGSDDDCQTFNDEKVTVALNIVAGSVAIEATCGGFPGHCTAELFVEVRTGEKCADSGVPCAGGANCEHRCCLPKSMPYKLLKKRALCRGRRLFLGNFSSVVECSSACAANGSCEYFTSGTTLDSTGLSECWAQIDVDELCAGPEFAEADDKRGEECEINYGCPGGADTPCLACGGGNWYCCSASDAGASGGRHEARCLSECFTLNDRCFDEGGDDESCLQSMAQWENSLFEQPQGAGHFDCDIACTGREHEGECIDDKHGDMKNAGLSCEFAKQEFTCNGDLGVVDEEAKGILVSDICPVSCDKCPSSGGNTEIKNHSRGLTKYSTEQACGNVEFFTAALDHRCSRGTRVHPGEISTYKLDRDIGCATIEGSGDCVFPFTYNGVTHHRCVASSHGPAWCSLTDDFDADGRWGTCPPDLCSHYLAAQGLLQPANPGCLCTSSGDCYYNYMLLESGWDHNATFTADRGWVTEYQKNKFYSLALPPVADAVRMNALGSDSERHRRSNTIEYEIHWTDFLVEVGDWIDPDVLLGAAQAGPGFAQIVVDRVGTSIQMLATQNGRFRLVLIAVNKDRPGKKVNGPEYDGLILQVMVLLHSSH